VPPVGTLVANVIHISWCLSHIALKEPDMIRKQLYIAPDQQVKLPRIAKNLGCTEAEIMRTALDRLPELVTNLDAMLCSDIA
jgi:hypothetical protein